MSNWEDIDFERLYKVLRIAAEAILRDAPETFDMGISAQDLAHETYSSFLESSNGLGWNPGRGTIEKFMVGVLWNKARTHLRKARRIGGSLDDPETALPEPSVAGSVDADVQFQNLREKLYQVLEDDPELRELIAATEQTSGEHNLNQELSEILGKPVSQVMSLKRRLLSNRKVIRFLWPKRL